MSKWVELADTIKKCKKCIGLNSEIYGTQNSPGYGSITSKVVIIGQSLCGDPCIKSQVPFTGGSGLLLDEAFKQINIEKKDIYITNVVKCHSPENRKSQEHEIENCSSYLENELSWLNPKHVICLGKDAWRKFDSTVTKPTLLTNNDVTVHYVYHPSYIKRKSKDVQKEYVNVISQIIQNSRNEKSGMPLN